MRPKLIPKLIMAVLFWVVGAAQAMTPGSEKSSWNPETIPQLTPKQVTALKAAKCKVVSYRNMEAPNMDFPFAPNTSGKPDERDVLMLVNGEFAKRGQKDVLALCQSSETGAEFFFTIWGGPARCGSKLMMSHVSRYWESRNSQLDYYGSTLGTMSPTDLRDFLTQMAGQPAHGVSEMGENYTWVMEKQKWPEFNHDAFSMSGNYSIAYYCDGKSWVPLFDSYSDEID